MIAFQLNDYIKLKNRLYRIAQKLAYREIEMNDDQYTIDMQPVKSYTQHYNGKFYGLTEIEFVEVIRTPYYIKYWLYIRFGEHKTLCKTLRVHFINNHLQYELN